MAVGGHKASWDDGGSKVGSGLCRYLGIFNALERLIGRSGPKERDIVGNLEFLPLSDELALYGSLPLG